MAHCPSASCLHCSLKEVRKGKLKQELQTREMSWESQAASAWELLILNYWISHVHDLFFVCFHFVVLFYFVLN